MFYYLLIIIIITGGKNKKINFLNDSSDEKIGCITVSVLPIRAEIELHNRKYWDALTMSLQTSILRDINKLNKYISDATEILNAQPKTMSEVGEANIKHAKLMETSVEVVFFFIC